MRLVWILAAMVTVALATDGQSFPQSVDLIQRIDSLYPWLNVLAFDVDIQGNTYLAGSSSLPVPSMVNIRTGPLGRMDFVVIKVDPSGQLIYGVAIGGTADEFVGHIKVDSAQNLYLIGTTNSVDYPALSSQGNGGNAIILKLDAGGAVVFNTRLSWAGAILTMALGPAGTAYIGGVPKPGELPTTLGAYRLSPAGSGGFVAKIGGTGMQLDAATYVDEAVTNVVVRATGDVVFSMGQTIAALDGSLSRLMFSTLTDVDTNIVNIGIDGSNNIYVAVPDAIRKFAPDGQRILWGRDFAPASFAHFAITPSGTAFLTGSVRFDYPNFHGTQACSGNLSESATGVAGATNGFLMAIGPEGYLLYGTFMAEEIPVYFPITESTDGHAYAFGQAFLILDGRLQRWQGILRFDADQLPGPHTAAECLVNLATMQPSPIAPGTIMTLLGEQLGPDAGVSFALQNGRMPFEVAGTSVTVDGVPAPVLYAQGSQINFIAPWSLRTDGAKVQICVTMNATSSCLYAATAPVAPGLLQVNSQIAAINPDETVNSPQHPAPGGTYVSVYMTGAGTIENPMVDGGIAGFDLQRVTAAAAATFTYSQQWSFGSIDQTVDAPILFAGAVPTLVYGVEVVIVKVPTYFALPTLVKFTLSLRPTPQSAVTTTSGYLYVK